VTPFLEAFACAFFDSGVVTELAGRAGRRTAIPIGSDFDDYVFSLIAMSLVETAQSPTLCFEYRIDVAVMLVTARVLGTGPKWFVWREPVFHVRWVAKGVSARFTFGCGSGQADESEPGVARPYSSIGHAKQDAI